MKKSLFTILFCLICSVGLCTTYYADPAGTSSNACTVGDPCNIEKAFGLVSTGSDDVCLNDGTYSCADHETNGCNAATDIITFTGVDGTSENNITISNCEGGEVIIEAVDHVTSWTNACGTNCYRSNTLTHTPNASAIVWNRDDPKLLKPGACSPNATDEFCVNTGSKYIEVYSTTDLTSTPGDYIVPYNADRIAQIRDAEYVTWDGIDLLGGQYRLLEVGQSSGSGHTSNVTVKNSTFMYGNSAGIFLNGTTSLNYDVVIDNVEVAYITNLSDNGQAIKCGSFDPGSLHSCEVKNSILHHTSHHTLEASAGVVSAKLHGNISYDGNFGGTSGGSWAGPNSSGRAQIMINSGDMTTCQVYDNITYETSDADYTSGIYFQGNADGFPSNALVYNNIGYDHHYHGLYIFSTGGTLLSDGKVFNNIWYDVGVAGIRLDDVSSLELVGNTIIDPGQYGIDLQTTTADGITLKNNMVDTTSATAFNSISGSTVTSSQYNNYYNAGGTNISHSGSGTVPGTGDTQAAGGFINRAGDNYQLSPGGNGWEDGTCLADPYDEDILGRVRAVQKCDQGAYESSKRRIL